MSFSRDVYTVRDHFNVDHLACDAKRTFCGLPWLPTDRIFGFAVGHNEHQTAWSAPLCDRCQVNLARMRLTPCTCDEDHDEDPF